MRLLSSVCPTAAATAAVLAACAGYRPLPLPDTVGAARAADLVIAPAQLPTRELAAHRFDPSDGLDETETAMLAVANNPQLRVLRDDAGVAHAQVFAAGLLPDPQVSFSQDFVTGGSGGAGATNPFGLGIAYDVGSLLTRSTRVAAAHWSERQLDLNLLWAEWQTVVQARVLFGQVLTGRSRVARLAAETAALTPLRQALEQSLAAGQFGFDAASAGLTAAADAQRRLTDARSALNDAEHALRQLLGLQAQAPLRLVGTPAPPAPSRARIDAVLATLPQRRPDLLALRAGYRAQDEKLREAILAQFPAINVGFTRARDNSGVFTSGFAISLNLPLFDRNRGQVAVERATRRQLRDDYAARLAAAMSDLDRLAAQLALQQPAQAQVAARAQRAGAALREAERAWAADRLDLPTYLSLRAAALDADLAQLDQQQAQAGAAIAVQALLGGDWSAHARAVIGADANLEDGSQSP